MAKNRDNVYRIVAHAPNYVWCCTIHSDRKSVGERRLVIVGDVGGDHGHIAVCQIDAQQRRRWKGRYCKADGAVRGINRERKLSRHRVVERQILAVRYSLGRALVDRRKRQRTVDGRYRDE